ncbi:hypothetical protein ABK040_000749 [Willaertia magna]
MLLSSGWNNGGCCSCKETSNNNNNLKVFKMDNIFTDFIKVISQCYFNQFPLEESYTISNELIENEKIITVECGGYHTHMLTENIFTKEQFLYQCGLNTNKVLSLQGENISVLTKSYKSLKVIRENNQNERIKQLCPGIDSFFVVTESGKLFASGNHYLTNSKLFQQVPQCLFNNELIECVCDYVNGVYVLTKSGSVYIAVYGRIKQFNLNALNGKQVLRLFSVKTILSRFYILTEGNHIYNVDKAKYTLHEQNLIDLINTGKSTERELIKYIDENKYYYDLNLFEQLNGLIVVVKRKDNNFLFDKKKFNNLMECNNQENKYWFCDVCVCFK